MTEPSSTPDFPPPSVVEVVDEHGETHWTAYGSELHKRYSEPQEVADAGTEVPSPGPDHDPSADDSGSGDGPGDDSGTDGGGDDGVPQSGSGGRTGKR